MLSIIVKLLVGVDALFSDIYSNSAWDLFYRGKYESSIFLFEPFFTVCMPKN